MSTGPKLLAELVEQLDSAAVKVVDMAQVKDEHERFVGHRVGDAPLDPVCVREVDLAGQTGDHDLIVASELYVGN